MPRSGPGRMPAPPAPPPGWQPPRPPSWAPPPGPTWSERAAVLRDRMVRPGTRTGPPTYLWQSVVCLLLFLPSAVVALMYSTQVTRLANTGDMTGAVRASRLARTWCIVTLAAFTAAVVALAIDIKV
jgi:Interferon-induced transmembrane protein